MYWGTLLKPFGKVVTSERKNEKNKHSSVKEYKYHCILSQFHYIQVKQPKTVLDFTVCNKIQIQIIFVIQTSHLTKGSFGMVVQKCCAHEKSNFAKIRWPFGNNFNIFGGPDFIKINFWTKSTFQESYNQIFPYNF